jgi:hypothetical protein
MLAWTTCWNSQQKHVHMYQQLLHRIDRNLVTATSGDDEAICKWVGHDAGMQRLDVPSNAILVRSAATLEQAQWGVQEADGSAYSKDPFRQTWSLLEDQKRRIEISHPAQNAPVAGRERHGQPLRERMRGSRLPGEDCNC